MCSVCLFRERNFQSVGSNSTQNSRSVLSFTQPNNSAACIYVPHTHTLSHIHTHTHTCTLIIIVHCIMHTIYYSVYIMYRQYSSDHCYLYKHKGLGTSVYILHVCARQYTLYTTLLCTSICFASNLSDHTHLCCIYI